MSSTPRRRPTSALTSRARLVAAAAIVPALLAGCGSGINPETYKERQLADATNASLGDVSAGNVYLNPTQDGSPHPPGSDVTGGLTLSNRGEQPDRLVGIRSDAASSITLLDGTQEVNDAVIPPGGRSAVDGFRLNGTNRPLPPASYVTLTLDFEKAGTRELRVPVATTFESKRTEESRIHEEEPGSVPGEAGEAGH